MLKKVLLGVLILVVIGIAFFIIRVYNFEFINYNADYPIPDLHVEIDSLRVVRGEYLVYGPGHCGHCHAPVEQLPALEGGEKVALTGGFGLEIDPGTFNAPNITTHSDGIGNLSDGEIYRMLRYNIRPNGHAAFDFMPFINMTDEDIYSIIAYLRTTEPVAGVYPESEYTFIGKMVRYAGAIKPGVPDKNIPNSIKQEVSIEYGKYLAYAVANCRGCHTERDMKTGEYIGEEYAGGFIFGPDNLTNGWTFVTPNLTNDAETGIMYGWTEDDFVKRMRTGRVHETSPMPWSAVQNMDEGDLKSIYRYLKTLEPVKNEIEKSVVQPG